MTDECPWLKSVIALGVEAAVPPGVDAQQLRDHLRVPCDDCDAQARVAPKVMYAAVEALGFPESHPAYERLTVPLRAWKERAAVRRPRDPIKQAKDRAARRRGAFSRHGPRSKK